MELTIADLKPFLPGLEAALDDETVSEVMINSPATVFIERAGRMTALDAPELTAEAVARAAVQIARPLAKDPHTEPIIDARLADGSRVAICTPPAAPNAAITIRRFGGRAFTIDELKASGALPAAVVDEAAALLRGGRNALISGGTGSGKTTLLNALASLLPGEGRVISIADTLELRLSRANCLRLEARGLADRDVTIRDLVRHSLRHRPDHIVVGEVRGAEAADLLQALNTGHGGSLATVHANNAESSLSPGDLRHAGQRRAALDRGLPWRGRRHRGRHSSDADARGGAPRRPDGAGPGLRRAGEPVGGRAGLAAAGCPAGDPRCAAGETAGQIETPTQAWAVSRPQGNGSGHTALHGGEA